MSLVVTCPHCGAHGEMTDMLEQVQFAPFTALHAPSPSVAARAASWDDGYPPIARFTCCGLWGDLAVAEPTPEEAA